MIMYLKRYAYDMIGFVLKSGANCWKRHLM